MTSWYQAIAGACDSTPPHTQTLINKPNFGQILPPKAQNWLPAICSHEKNTVFDNVMGAA